MSATASLSAADLSAALGLPAPTPEQCAVIEAPLGNLLVVAGAGSGKTETMTSRVVWLVANGLVAPEEVLGLTFTRKAASELSSRIRRRLGELDRLGLARGPGGGGPADEAEARLLGLQPQVSTYHAYAAAIVGEHGLRLGVEPDARLLSEAGAWQCAHGVVLDYTGDMSAVDAAPATVTAAVLALAGEVAEHLADLNELEAFHAALESRIEELPSGRTRGGAMPAAVTQLLALTRARRQLLPLVTAYQERKRSADLLDFSDQIRIAAQLARQVPEVVWGERSRHGVVLLDEFQDTSEAQLVFLRAVFADPCPDPTRPAANNNAGHGTGASAGAGTRTVTAPVPVTAVGDPNQAIYGWRGASATTLTRFPREFPLPDGAPAPVLPLSTSWRNDERILAVANVSSARLREDSRVPIPRLVPAPEAAEGAVEVARYPTMTDEAEAVARWIAAQWGSHESAAVLCRRRSQFPPIVAALTRHGLPVEVVGLGGLLDDPDVTLLVSLLTAATDAGRGDALSRLLVSPAVALGAADLDGIGAWARELDRRHRPDPADRTPDAPRAPQDPPITLIEAVETLPPPQWRGASGQRIGAEARARLVRLRGALRAVRESVAMPLPDLVGVAERALGLDVEVLTRPGVPRAEARDHLDAFVEVAASYAAGADRPTPSAFLAWLAAAAEQERGLDMPTRPPRDRAVTVLTVHAAKGLEWDCVAVPGLIEGVFPAASSSITTFRDGRWNAPIPKDRGWLVGLGALPYPLRGDRDGLPVLEWERAETLAELATQLETFALAGGEHAVDDERRLAYVAMTRARHRLLLSTSVWTEASTPRVTSRFLDELACRHDEISLGQWTGMPQPGTDGTPPMRPDPPAADASWPPRPGPDGPDVAGSAPAVGVPAGVFVGVPEGMSVAEAAERVAAQLETADGQAGQDPLRDLDPRLRLLLTERARGEDPAVITLPDHLSTSDLVALSRDSGAYAAQLRRPMPMAPTPGSRRGSAFHAWVQRHYQHAVIFDIDELAGLGQEGDDTDLDGLKERFLASPWAAAQPVAVELDVETVIAGVAVRGRIDAVFAREDGYDIVDWKTGSPPDGARGQTQAVQLAAYRLAFARLHGIPTESVRAAFFYARTGETVYPVMPGERELAALLTAGLPDPAVVDPSAGRTSAPGRRDPAERSSSRSRSATAPDRRS